MNNFSGIIKNKFFSAISDFGMLSNTTDVVVGFSGGADSVCLLHLLNSYKDVLNIKVKAIHINHGIRGPEAKRDKDFAVAFCEKHNITYETFLFDCVSEAKNTKESLEECGRRIRYEIFNKNTTDTTKIATAHNANDNAETVVFNVSRGSSIKGVCGIAPVRDNIIRPIIYCTREEIEGYCEENNLLYVTDSTNLCDDYTRNKIRHKILPVMEEVNSSAIANVSAFCEDARNVADYISLQAKAVLDSAYICENTYDVSALKNQHISVVNEAIYIAFSGFSDNSIDRNKIKIIYDLLNKTGRAQLYGNEFVEVVKGKLRFFRKSDTDVDVSVTVNGVGEYLFGSFKIVFLNYDYCSKNVNKNILDNLIDCDKIKGHLFLRTRKEGDRFSFYNRKVSKSLKKLFNEYSIPVEQRDFIPVLCDDDGIVWVYGFGVTARCHISESSCNIICIEGENNG